MAQKKINVKEKLSSDGTEIDLSILELQDVPVKELAAFKKVITLDLFNNSIQKLPKSFPTLTHIVRLDLSKNLLEELPENFGDLVKLRYLDLYHNKLRNLPLSFSKLKSLNWLDLQENPLETILVKVAGPCETTKQCQICARNIVAYLTRKQARADAEREEKAKQKKLLQQIELKKDEKKPKKPDISKPNNGNNVQVLTKTEKKRLKKLKKQSEVSPGSSGSSYVFVFLILMLVFFVLTSIEWVYLIGLEDMVIESYFSLIGLLPENLRVYGVLFADYFKIAHVKTGQFVLAVSEFVQTNEHCQTFIRGLKIITGNLFSKIRELYYYWVR